MSKMTAIIPGFDTTREDAEKLWEMITGRDHMDACKWMEITELGDRDQPVLVPDCTTDEQFQEIYDKFHATYGECDEEMLSNNLAVMLRTDNWVVLGFYLDSEYEE